ncbi:anti-sigma regulatory factor [Streptomyces sp. KM273126]|uniref:ATP-binding protein n=1 Tax=Streptomyces sp. KM273126 TaxID=2545247 RepID=UPI00215DB932|nr:ATP-binding protein [Streptomyces sp. KM273126]
MPGEPPSWDGDQSWDDDRAHGRSPEPVYSRMPEHPRRSEVFGLPATPASVRQAREIVREVLDAWGAAPELCDDAVLVISELVTNAFTHTRSDRVVCRLNLGGGRLRVEVEDQNRDATLPEQRQPDSDDQNGRGLMLVCALSSDWGAGASAHGSGSVVWAELAWRPAEPAPAAVDSPVRETRSPVWEAASPIRGSEAPSSTARPVTKGVTAPPDGSAPPLTAAVPLPAARRPAVTSSHVTRPVPRSAEGHLPHGTPAFP